MRPLPSLRCKSAFDTPPTTNAAVESKWFDIENPSPFSGRLCFTVVFEKMIRPFVVRLLMRVCPSTVFRGVALTVVNPIKRFSFRSFTNIRREIGKTFPPIANSYSAPSVVFPFVSVWVGTPANHPGPHDINRASNHAVGSSGFVMGGSKTPAGANLSCDKVVGSNLCYVPARTLANPSWCAGLGITLYNGQLAENLTSSVNKLWHFVTSKLLTVKDAWQSAVRQIFGSYPSQAGVILA